MNRITADRAETIALQALAFLAQDDDLLGAFLTASGASPDDMKVRAQDADFLGFVIDFLMGDDAIARSFCQAENLSAETLHFARAALPGGQVPDWT